MAAKKSTPGTGKGQNASKTSTKGTGKGQTPATKPKGGEKGGKAMGSGSC